MTLSSSFVRNGRQDVIASNPLAQALHTPMFDSPTAGQHGRPNVVRYIRCFRRVGLSRIAADAAWRLWTPARRRIPVRSGLPLFPVSAWSSG
ncbi:hypothetical protein [Streptomyces sp. NPDC097610]|uniref:hypothetical protein n=1 Tax=Streptomyces sp. NPDC097610 TaxID=3157227 RepID=UPI00331A34D8